MIDHIQVGKRICAMRLGRGLTQQQLATMLGVSHQAVSRWESGQTLPDISTMLELTRFFGISVEELIEGQQLQPEQEEEAQQTMEVKDMNIQQLVQMAPFMSKEAVEEIALAIPGEMSAAEMVKIAPFMRTEAVEKLIETHRPDLDWDSLRKLAPFMGRDAVDRLARSIASGETTVKPAVDPFNKTMNDIGKVFDDFGREVGKTFDGIGREVGKTFDEIGKGVDSAFKKAVRFGENVVSEVSKAFSCDDDGSISFARSERTMAIRRKAFERALDDGRWDWLGAHIGEIYGDEELMDRIAATAREEGRHDFIRNHMSAYADMETIDQAIAGQNWQWLGENVWQFDCDVQEKIALAAAEAQNWDWLAQYSDPLKLIDCGYEISHAALLAGQISLVNQLAENHLVESQCHVLAEVAYGCENFDALSVLLGKCSAEFRERILLELAGKGDWDHVCAYARHGEGELLEKLLEAAVDQGNFDAIDLLDAIM